MTLRFLKVVFVCSIAIASQSCTNNSTTPEESVDLTGFWSGRTTYDVSASCDLLGCYYESRMMIVQTGKTVSGWFRARANQVSDQTSIAGTIQGDTLSLLVNALGWVGPMKFSVSSNGRSIVARQDKKIISLTLE